MCVCVCVCVYIHMHVHVLFIVHVVCVMRECELYHKELCESVLVCVEGVWAYVCLYGGVKEIVVRASFFTATIYHDHAAVTCTKHKLSSYSHNNSVAYFSFFAFSTTSMMIRPSLWTSSNF